MAKEQVKEQKGQAEVGIMCITREPFTTSDGRDLNSYIIEGAIRGRKTKVDFEAYDKGGYEVLDMIFDMGDGKTAEFIMTDETMVDSKTGEVRAYNNYFAQNVDEDGIPLSCRLKLKQDSDKSILNYLIMKANAAKAKAEAEAAAKAEAEKQK